MIKYSKKSIYWTCFGQAYIRLTPSNLFGLLVSNISYEEYEKATPIKQLKHKLTDTEQSIISKLNVAHDNIYLTPIISSGAFGVGINVLDNFQLSFLILPTNRQIVLCSELQENSFKLIENNIFNSLSTSEKINVIQLLSNSSTQTVGLNILGL